MDRAGRRRCLPALAAVLMLAVAAPASAHVVRTAGPYTFEIGWGTEPPLAGFENLVEVTVTDAGDEPVADLGRSAAVEVIFGDDRTVLPLAATEVPGEFHATIVPTRPGTYEFAVNATAGDRAISTGAKCGEGTFDCVIPAAEAQFPVADPTVGEVAGRISSTLPRTEQAADDADAAKRLAIAAIAIAAIALGAAIVIAIRTRRKSA